MAGSRTSPQPGPDPGRSQQLRAAEIELSALQFGNRDHDIHKPCNASPHSDSVLVTVYFSPGQGGRGSEGTTGTNSEIRVGFTFL